MILLVTAEADVTATEAVAHCVFIDIPDGIEPRYGSFLMADGAKVCRWWRSW